MKVLLAHPGTQYSYQLAKELETRGLLYKFYTCFAIAEISLFFRLIRYLPYALQRKISNRIIKDISKIKIKVFFRLELNVLISLKIGQDPEEVFYKRNKKFQEEIPDSDILESDLIIGFDTSSWILLKRCKQLNRKFILDVSIAHPIEKEKIYNQIVLQYPDWSFAIKHKSAALIESEQQELENADVVVVASSFTKQSLIKHGIHEDTIFVNPYGVDSQLFFPTIKLASKKINFVFVGLVDARKGIPILLDTWEQISKSEATLSLIGPVSNLTSRIIQKKYPEINILGKIPFSELSQTFSKYDVLVFPSYFEGFGLVILEAMACGLPVITTTATCGADIIDDGHDGLIIETGSIYSLLNAMESIIEGRYNLLKMGKQAREKASILTWNAYGERWEKIIRYLK
jgi:glycosyltransferase involved in cell wall biosynthesis